LSLRINAWPKQKNERENPFQSLLYAALDGKEGVRVIEFGVLQLLLDRKPTIYHIHWPDAFLASVQGWRFWVKLVFLRVLFIFLGLRGIPVVWTAHNLKRPGQRNTTRMNKYFWPWFAKRIDGIIYMTEASKLKAEEMFDCWRDTPNAVIPHGHYRPIIDNSPSTSTLKVSSKPQLLFFGSITNYKNAYQLLNAFLALPSGTATLAIKGKMSKVNPDNRLLQCLDSLPSECEEEVIFDNRFLDDAELIEAIQSSDIVVFPYSDVLNSGAAIFALSVGRPILASNTPLFRELQKQVGQQWVRLIDGELDAVDLKAALKHANDLRKLGASPDLSVFEWEAIADQTLKFYHRVIVSRADKLA
jgi:beta-1,4-mannosyltransferase